MSPKQKLMAKRSKALQETIKQINEILKNEYVVTTDENGDMLNASSNSAEGIAFKDGLAVAMEIVLHHYNSYKGWRYNNDTHKRHERQFY